MEPLSPRDTVGASWQRLDTLQNQNVFNLALQLPFKKLSVHDRDVFLLSLERPLSADQRLKLD
jgi:hypothetical protein